MRYPELKSAVGVLCIALLLAVGCKKHAPLEAISPERAPATLQQAFSKARPEIKKLADEVVAAMQNQEYPKAHTGIQALCAVPELTEDQRRVASACLLTLSAQLQAAQARGDEKAAEAVRQHLLNR